MSAPKQLSFGETVKLVTDFSQELRRQPFPAIDPNVQRSLAPLPLSYPIAPRIEQRRFLAEHPPVLVVVKRIQNGAVYAEEQTRDGSRPARLVSMSEEDFSRLPYDCRFFQDMQAQYDVYCQHNNVIPFQGFRSPEDMRLFYCGFWLNCATMPSITKPETATRQTVLSST